MDARGMRASQVTNEWRKAATRGTIDVVEVQEGDRIRPGEVLVRLKAPAALGRKLEKELVRAAVKLQASLQEQELKLNEQNESVDDYDRQLEEIADELSEAESKKEQKKLRAEQRKLKSSKKKALRGIKSVTRKLKGLRKRALASQKKLDKLEAALRLTRSSTLATGTVMQVNAKEGSKGQKIKLVLIEDGGSVEIQFMMKSVSCQVPGASSCTDWRCRN